MNDKNRFVYLYNLINAYLQSGKMAQRSITSFFSKAPAKKTENDLNGSPSSQNSKTKKQDEKTPQKKETLSKEKRINIMKSINADNYKDFKVWSDLKRKKCYMNENLVQNLEVDPIMKAICDFVTSKVDSGEWNLDKEDPPKDFDPEVYFKIAKEVKAKHPELYKDLDKSSDTEEEPVTTKPKRKSVTKADLFRQKASNVKLKKGRKRILNSESSSDEEPQDKKIKLNKTEAKQAEEKMEVKSEEDSTPVKEKENKTPPKKTDKDARKSDADVKDEKSPKETKKTVKMVNFFAKKSDTTDSDKDYNPAKNKYHPIKDAAWKKDEKIPFEVLAKTWSIIESTSSRLQTITILSNFFRSVILLTPSSLLASVYLCLNRLAPTFHSLELGIADTFLIKAIAQSTGRSPTQIKADLAVYGDLGLVAEKSRQNQKTLYGFRPKKLTIDGIFVSLKEVAGLGGKDSQQKKVDKIKGLLVACEMLEARFLVRLLAGKLRIGLAEQSILQAVAQACATTPPNQTEITDASSGVSADKFKQIVDNLALILKTTYCECPNYDKIIPVILQTGIESLPDHCKLTPGVPLKPMLAHPTKGVQEVLSRFDGLKFTCEWKYDGERAQIHRTETGEIKIYSRNQEDNTSKYPDIINRIEKCLKPEVKSFILDCESVAWDREQKRILPFQILSTRKRKDANEDDIKVQVCVFMFDLLYLNGVPLVREPFLHRRSLLRSNFIEIEGESLFATSLDVASMEEVQDFLEESVKGNCEGLMVKTLEKDATYEIAKRSRNWLKLKKDYLEGVGDTLDVVAIGGYLGKGKRTGSYGGFLLAVYDPQNEEYQSICKIGTGFTEESLQKFAEFYKNHIIPQPKSYYRYDNSHLPDHWFDAVQVWEIKCADLSLSPVHYAGIGIVDAEKGISLRFPRFIRIRDDKSPEDATSAQQVADMYQNQDQIKNQPAGVKNEEDFY